MPATMCAHRNIDCRTSIIADSSLERLIRCVPRCGPGSPPGALKDRAATARRQRYQRLAERSNSRARALRPNRYRPARVCEDHARLVDRDLSPEEAELAAAVALVIRPVGELLGRGRAAERDGAF